MADLALRRRKRSARCGRFFSVALLLTGLSACEPSGKAGDQPQTSAEPLNVLLITLDTTRADALGAYGQPLPTTPNIDQLAHDGVVFRNAMSTAPITLPSHASMMTATYPFVHGARSNGQYVLSEQNVTLAEILQEHGYRTAAEIGSVVLNRRTGMAQGFAIYRDLDSPGIDRVKVPSKVGGANSDARLPERSATDISRHGIEFLQAVGREPFFLWLHYFAPHAPYVPPEGLQSQVGGDSYLGEVRYVDREIGAVLAELDKLGLMDKTLIVITSDHGESRGDHGEVRHSFLVYDSTVHIPLIMHGPAGIGRGLQIDAVVRLIDIAPTVLDLLGLPSMKDVQGVSLSPLLNGLSSDLDLLAYGESSEPNKIFGSSILRFVRLGNLKYIHKRNPELYDISADSTEARNLAGEQPARVAALQVQLSALIAMAPEKIHSGETHLNSEEADQLVALGYVTAGQVPEAESPIESLELNGPDPNDVVADQSAFELLMDAWRTQRSEESYRGIKDLALRYPDSFPYGEAYLGIALQKKEYRDVSELVEQTLARGADLAAFWPNFMVEVAADIDVVRVGSY